jgi:DNA-binding LacI/PurR family transcriptional regulator
LYEIGIQSCERLIDLVHHKVQRVQEVVPTYLVVRESCGEKTKDAVAQPH